MKLSLLKEKLAICRLDRSAPVPAWLTGSAFFTVSRTFDELSLVCPQESVPDGVLCNKGWRCLKVDGPLEFSLTGVIASVTAPLANAKVPVFVFPRMTRTTSWSRPPILRRRPACCPGKATSSSISTSSYSRKPYR